MHIVWPAMHGYLDNISGYYIKSFREKFSVCMYSADHPSIITLCLLIDGK